MTRDDLELVLLTGRRLGFADAADMAAPGGGYTARAVRDMRAALDHVGDGVDPLALEVITAALESA